MSATLLDFTAEHRADALVSRIQREFEEMPALSLSLEQARRFFGLDAWLCEHVFQSLEQTGFLCRNSRGAYRRPA
jgi:hypothetical protein